MQTILTYAVAILVILGLCALGLSIGVILRGRAFQTCGRAAGGEEIVCPACGQGSCRREARDRDNSSAAL